MSFNKLSKLSIFCIILIILIMFLSGCTTQQTALSSDIFCNDYEFTCCVPTSSEGNSNIDWTHTFQCPSNSVDCIVTSSGKTIGYGSENCRIQSDWSSAFLPRIKCDNEQYTIANSLKISPNYQVWGGETGSITLNYKIDGRKLTFCGRSGCTQGADIKSDSCAFTVTNGSIYDSVSKSDKGISYTVPVSQCVLSWQSTDRHICGTLNNECNSDSDCIATHPNTCTGRTLQGYYCSKSNLPSTISYINGQYYSSTSDPFDTQNIQVMQNKCIIGTAKPVQCCGDTDCGSNAFCDKTTYTCKATTQCTQNSDCGVSVQCDYSTLNLKTPICSFGKCSYSNQKIDCCSDTQCNFGYFCNANYKCEQSNPNIKFDCKEAGFQCCIAEDRYFDLYCPQGKYCNNHVCQSQPSCKSNSDCLASQECYNGQCIEKNLQCNDQLLGLVKGNIGTKEQCGFFDILCNSGITKPVKVTSCIYDYTLIYIVGGLILISIALLLTFGSNKGKGKPNWIPILIILGLIAIVGVYFFLMKYLFLIIIIIIILIIAFTILQISTGGTFGSILSRVIKKR